jgi:S1-C subfamily serine protease
MRIVSDFITERGSRGVFTTLACALCLLFCILAPNTVSAQDPTESTVVQVIATFQEYDSFMPWQTRNHGTRYGYGMLIGDSLVITTEALVRNTKLVELRKAQQGEKIAARVIASDCEANLALLEVIDKKAFSAAQPLGIADTVPKLAEVGILQFDGTGQIQHGKGRVIEIAMARLPNAGYSCLTFELLTDLNINSEGAGVISNGKLAGLIMAYDRDTRIGTMLPYAVIRQFLDNVNNPPYKGFASAGFIWKPLVDPTKRRYLHVSEPGSGVLILSTLPETSAHDAFKPDDVILEWNGHPIDNLGFYTDPQYGRLAFSYLIKGKGRPGDVVPVKLIRDKKEQTVELTLCHRNEGDNLIPENTIGEQAEYLVSGGFIIRELTGRYLRSYGNNWQSEVDARLGHLYLSRRLKPESTGERILILSGVMPDPINIGYQHFRNIIVTHVNGTKVDNLNDVFELLKKDKVVSRLTLHSVGVDIVLDADKLQEANQRISETYRISAQQKQRALRK